jgi:hypothetical protein
MPVGSGAYFAGRLIRIVEHAVYGKLYDSTGS